MLLFLQSLSASLNGKKADAGPWIDILTSRDTDHLNKGEAFYICLSWLVQISFCQLESCQCFKSECVPPPDLVLYIIDSVDGTGAADRTDGG